MHYRPPHLYCGCLAILLVAPRSADVQASEKLRLEQPNDVAYWDAVYSESARAGVKIFSHAWQGVDLETLRGVLKLKAQPHDRYIVLGAGDSGLPEELFDAGCRNVTAVDFSTKLVRAMAERSHGVLWRLEDARKLSFAEASFDVVLDVGLLDSVAVGGDEQVAEMLSGVHRMLAAGGTYASVSTEPPLYRLPSFLPQSTGKDGWDTRVLFIPRARSLDQRVRRIDPALDMGKLSVYVSVKGTASNGTENGTEVPSVEPGGETVRVSGGAASASEEQSESRPPSHRRGVESVPSTVQEAGSSPSSGEGAETQAAELSDHPDDASEAAPGPLASAEAKPDDSAGRTEEPLEVAQSVEATAAAKPAEPAKPEEPSETVPAVHATAEAKPAEPAGKPVEHPETAPIVEAIVEASAKPTAQTLAKPDLENTPAVEASADVELADPAVNPEGPSETSQPAEASAEIRPAEPAETAELRRAEEL